MCPLWIDYGMLGMGKSHLSFKSSSFITNAQLHHNLKIKTIQQEITHIVAKVIEGEGRSLANKPYFLPGVFYLPPLHRLSGLVRGNDTCVVGWLE